MQTLICTFNRQIRKLLMTNVSIFFFVIYVIAKLKNVKYQILLPHP